MSQERELTREERAIEREKESILRSLRHYMGERYYGEDRMKKLKEIHENAESACVPIGLAARVATRADLFEKDVETNGTNEGKVNLKLVYDALQIPTGRMMINEAMREHVMTCAVQSIPGNLGAFVLEGNAIFTAVDKLSTPDVSALNTITFYEELAHAYQTHEQDMVPGEKRFLSREYRIDDYAAWNLFIEADAKVMAALMIMEHSEAGDDSKRQYLLNSNEDPDKDVFLKVNELYEEHGAEALRKNPELLRPAFEAFLQDKNRMGTYADNILKAGVESYQTERELYDRYMAAKTDFLTPARFRDAFGRKYGYDVDTRAEIVGLLQPDHPLTKWVKGEMSFLDAAKEGGYDPNPPKPETTPEAPPPETPPEETTPAAPVADVPVAQNRVFVRPFV
jgi:hypothetical protein